MFWKHLKNVFQQNKCNVRTNVNNVWPRSKGKTINDTWYTPKLPLMNSIVMSMLDIYNRYSLGISTLAYVKCRNEYKVAIKVSKKSYNSELIDRSSQICKTVWKVINKVSKSNRQNQNGITVVNPEIFNELVVPLIGSQLPLLSRNQSKSNFCFTDITPDLVVIILLMSRLQNI